MGLVESLKQRLFGRRYICRSCGNEFRGNRNACPECQHTVFDLAG